MALSAALAGPGETAPARRQRRRGAAAAAPPTAAPEPTSDDDDDVGGDDDIGPVRAPAADRRRAVEILFTLWAGVARDLVLVGDGGTRSVQDTVLLEELTAISSAIAPGSAAAFLARIARSAELLAGNVSPELVLDSLVLAWPRRVAAA
jgi:hypothetical protein